MQEFICKYEEIVTYWLRGRDCLSGVTCFSFCEKYVRDVFRLLFASAKSNQKQTKGCGPLDSQGAVQNPCGGILDKI